MKEVIIPAVGDSITSANLASWHVEDNSYVNKGDLLLTMETDKVSNELSAEESGVIQLLVAEDEEVPIGTVVAKIDTVAQSAKTDTPKQQVEKKVEDNAAEKVVEKIEDKPAVTTTPLQDSTPSAKVEQKVQNATNDNQTVAKSVLPVPKKEIFAALHKKPFDGESTTSTSLTSTVTENKITIPAAYADKVERKKMTMLRRKVAAHLLNAQQNAAILTTFNEVNMEPVMSLRKTIQEDFVSKYQRKIGFMSFFVKAVVSALQAVPQINASIDGNEIIQYNYYDIGVAVGSDKGLFVPVVRECESKSFYEIEADIATYAAKANEGKIAMEDLENGTFTISNGGVYGSLLSTPILNPPQSGILGMHNIQQRPIAVDGKVIIAPMMYLALSYDHRLVDGKEAVSFLLHIKEKIENPLSLLI